MDGQKDRRTDIKKTERKTTRQRYEQTEKWSGTLKDRVMSRHVQRQSD